MNIFVRRLTTALLISLIVLPAALAQKKFQYPATKKVDHKDTYHGVEVADPYRWLETDVRESKDVESWINAENKVTFDYLQGLPYRSAIKKRLTDMWNFRKFGVPTKEGGRYYYVENNGLQNQYVLYVQDSLADAPRVLIDPNTWSKDGTVALAGKHFSDDGRYLAYGVAEAGSDWNTWRVIEIDTGRVLPDEIKWAKFSSAAWTKDGEGFFYGRYPEPEKGAAFQSLNKNMKIYYHRLGTPQSEDKVVFFRPEQPEWGYEPEVTDDGRYLVLTFWKGTDAKYQVHVKDLEDPYSMPAPLIEDFENEYSFIANNGPVFYFKTDLNAPRRRVIAIDLRNPERSAWKEVIPQSESLLDDVDLIGNNFVAEYLKDARSEVKIYTAEGKHVRDVDFGQIGTAKGFAGTRTDPETFYSFESFATPPTIYRYDVATGDKKVIFRSNVAMKPED